MTTVETIDNINDTVAEDLKKVIRKGSKVSIASACFSIYAYEALKKELSNVESLRFIFTSPTFLEEKVPREKKEFYIPTLVNDLIKAGKATCEVLDTSSKWFGVTYPEDRQSVVDKIKALVDAGEYPEHLFN